MNTRSDESPMAIARHLLFGGQPLPALGAIPKRPARATLDATTLSGYEGWYRLDSGGSVEVARRGNHLLVQVLGEGVATYFASDRDLFWGNTDDADLRFDRDAGGRVSTLTLRAGSVTRVSSRMRCARHCRAHPTETAHEECLVSERRRASVGRWRAPSPSRATAWRRGAAHDRLAQLQAELAGPCVIHGRKRRVYVRGAGDS